MMGFRQKQIIVYGKVCLYNRDAQERITLVLSQVTKEIITSY